jgi:molecular chaperone GrpE
VEDGDVSAGLPDGLELEDVQFEELEFDPLAVVAAERDAYLDGLLRLKAEFENFRKRADRDVLEARSRARMGLLAEFLPVLDNLERALNAAEHHEEGKVLEGVRLTHSMFADLLRKEGVTEVDPLGAAFDPHMHEALMTQPSDSEEGTVTAVFERGYVFGDRVLRPAKVVVSAGPARE